MFKTATKLITLALAILATTQNIASGKSHSTPENGVWEKNCPSPVHVGQNAPQAETRIGLTASASEKLPQAISFGQWVAVEEVLDTGEWEVVYNLRIADYHTYFVTDWDWGFSVWSHNTSGGCSGDLVVNGVTLTRRPEITDATGTYRFTYDSEKRTRTVTGPIKAILAANEDRKPGEQTKMLNAFFGPVGSPLRNQYDAGHLIGNQLGGPGDVENLVPMAKIFNQNRAWKQFEEWLSKSVNDNRNADMTVTMNYGSNQNSPQKWIPDSFDVSLDFTFASTGNIAGNTRTFHFNNSNTAPIQVNRNSPTPGSVLDR